MVLRLSKASLEWKCLTSIFSDVSYGLKLQTKTGGGLLSAMHCIARASPTTYVDLEGVRMTADSPGPSAILKCSLWPSISKTFIYFLYDHRKIIMYLKYILIVLNPWIQYCKFSMLLFYELWNFISSDHHYRFEQVTYIILIQILSNYVIFCIFTWYNWLFLS